MKLWLPTGLWLLLSLAPGLAQEHQTTPLVAEQVLEVCQQALGELEPLFIYTQPLDQKRLLVRLVLGLASRPVVRLTLDAQGEPVTNGLETAAPVDRPGRGADPQFLLRYLDRLDSLRPQLLLANWVLPEQRGHRCFVVYRGRVVGILRLSSHQQVISQPSWRIEFQQSRIRWPSQRFTPPGSPQLP
jgi:hypothetical protein